MRTMIIIFIRTIIKIQLTTLDIIVLTTTITTKTTIIFLMIMSLVCKALCSTLSLQSTS